MKKIIRNKPAEERFWMHVNKNGNCWEWQIGKDKDGYGIFTINGKSYKAHRKSYEYEVGKIEDGFFVLHKCDNPPCVRPSHLFLGTARDNTNDMLAKGRNLFGENSTKAKLKVKDVILIRKIYANHQMTETDIAKQFNITQGAVGHIINRRSWNHI